MQRKKQIRKYSIIAITSIIVLFIAMHIILPPKKRIFYITANVTRGNIQQSILVSGTIRNESRVEVGAQTSGQITAIDVTLGEHVKKGQLIATIDSQTQEDEFLNTESQYKSYSTQLVNAKEALAVAQNNYNINKKLFLSGAISQVTFNSYITTLANAKSSVASLQASVTQASLNVSTAKTNLSYTKITAPISGTVISIPVSVGQTVNANYNTPTIVQLANLTQMYNEIDIPEANINSVKLDDPVKFVTMDGNTNYSGKIDSINPAITTLTNNSYDISVYNTNPVYYYADVNISNPNYQLKIGMLTQNTIILATYNNVLLIPSDAIKFSGSKAYVDILVNHKPEQRFITTGVSNNTDTIVLTGLNVGDKVIISSSTVRPQSATPGKRGL